MTVHLGICVASWQLGLSTLDVRSMAGPVGEDTAKMMQRHANQVHNHLTRYHGGVFYGGVPVVDL